LKSFFKLTGLLLTKDFRQTMQIVTEFWFCANRTQKEQTTK